MVARKVAIEDLCGLIDELRFREGRFQERHVEGVVRAILSASGDAGLVDVGDGSHCFVMTKSRVDQLPIDPGLAEERRLVARTGVTPSGDSSLAFRSR